MKPPRSRRAPKCGHGVVLEVFYVEVRTKGLQMRLVRRRAHARRVAQEVGRFRRGTGGVPVLEIWRGDVYYQLNCDVRAVFREWRFGA